MAIMWKPVNRWGRGVALVSLVSLVLGSAVGPPVEAQLLPGPGVSVGLALDRATYLASDPIQVIVALTNVSGAPVVTAQSVTKEPLPLLLTFIDPDGLPIIAQAFGSTTHEGGPPPTLLLGTEYVQVDPVVVLAPGASSAVTLPNARLFYLLTKPGRYTVTATVPLRTYPAILRTGEDGTAYAQLDTALFGGAMTSNTVEFFLVVDADGDGYAYPVPEARLSAQLVADCNDQNAAVNPGRVEIPNNGVDDDCNPATPDDAPPPVTTATLAPAPNANGWNKTAVTVTLTATDASGIRALTYTLTGALTGTLTGPGALALIPMAAEGVTTVTFQATDTQGLQESLKTQGVRVDTTPPTLTVPPSPLTVNATSAAGAVVSYTVSASDILDPAPALVCAPPSGSTFPIGTTTVTCTATDRAGNSTIRNVTVIVVAVNPTQRVSVSSTGGQGNQASVGATGTVSSDGRYVAFTSSATTLVPGDTNANSDVFVYDRQTAQTTRVSVSSSGAQANGASVALGLSADGRAVVFLSSASNLVPGDTNGQPDLFVYDRPTAQTTRVSVASTGTQANGASTTAALSSDGRYVAFASSATNLVSGDTNAKSDVFVRDRTTSQTTRVSVASAGTQGTGDSLLPALSGDGRYVAFLSSASNLVTGDTNGQPDLFVYDRQTAQTTRVSVASTGTQANGASTTAALSSDGRYVAFASSATNLVSGDTNAKSDVFVRDRTTSQTTRVSVASAGTQGTGDSLLPGLSADGRFVVFASSAANLVTGDTNGTFDIFVRDRTTNQTKRASVGAGSLQSTADSLLPAVSGDGLVVGFTSSASNLVSGDTNAVSDVFVTNTP